MTEVCVQVFKDLESVKKSVLKEGYSFIETYNNYDTYFTTISKNEVADTPYKQLLDNSLIVRHIVGDDCDIKNLVYKKKVLDDNGNVIEEVKTKLNIDNIESAKKIFYNLGLACWCDYVNQNYVYKKGEVSIIIQYVKELGVFVEIEEFKLIKDKTDKEKFEILMETINSLRLPIGNNYSCKKPYMFLNLKK